MGLFRIEIHVFSCRTGNTTPAAHSRSCKISRPPFGQRIIYEINDPSAKYENLEKKLKIQRFKLSPSSGMVVWNGKHLKLAEIKSKQCLGCLAVEKIYVAGY